MIGHKVSDVRPPHGPAAPPPAPPRHAGRDVAGEAPHRGSASASCSVRSSGNDPRVIAALESYLEALRSGRACPKDEFLARHAEISEALGECLSGLEFIQSAAVQFVDWNEDRPRSQAEPILPRAQLGDYRILREVGRGGMGVVYEAEQLSLGRRVALKVLPFAAAIDPKQRQRFQIESQAAAQLHHPHIVPIFGVGCEGGIHYYAMQFVEGCSLADVVRELQSSEDPPPGANARSAATSSVETEEATPTHVKANPSALAFVIADETGPAGPVANAARPEIPLSLASTAVGSMHRDRAFCRQIARIGAEAADAMDHAHGLGVLHRDIKPANLLIDRDGSVWITDFGLARFHGELSLTGTGDVVGTLRYMSPEQALARRGVVDQRTDVYALGVTLYELLTLRPAFDGRDHQELLRQIALEEPARPRRLNPTIPLDLETIVLKAMAKELPNRYATAQELGLDLRRFLDDRPIVARRPGLLERIHRQSRRHWKQLVTAGAIVATCLILGAIATWTQVLKTEAVRREQHAFISVTFPWVDHIAMQAMGQTTQALNGAADAVTREELLKVFELAERFYWQASRLTPSGSDDLESRTIIARAYSRLGFTEAVLSTVKLTQAAADPRAKPQAEADSRRLMGQAEADYRRSVELFDALLAESRGDRMVRRYGADALGTWGLGWYLGSIGRVREAEPHHRRAIRLLRELVHDPDPRIAFDPGENPTPGAESDDILTLAGEVSVLTTYLDGANRAREADDQLRQLDDDMTFVVTRFAGPAHRGLRHHWLTLLAHNGHSYLAQQDNRRSAAMFFRMAHRLDPEDDAVRNNLAWMLASVPADPWFDPTRATALARKAVEAEPENGLYWNTLGVSAYRLGDWKTAEEALRKATKLQAGGSPAHNWFFLAMTLRHRGQCRDARQFFDQAVDWRKKENSDDPELRRFHAEAAELLGLPGPEPKAGPHPPDSAARGTPAS